MKNPVEMEPEEEKDDEHWRAGRRRKRCASGIRPEEGAERRACERASVRACERERARENIMAFCKNK